MPGDSVDSASISGESVADPIQYGRVHRARARTSTYLVLSRLVSSRLVPPRIRPNGEARTTHGVPSRLEGRPSPHP
jgi:hypothetical protein